MYSVKQVRRRHRWSWRLGLLGLAAGLLVGFRGHVLPESSPAIRGGELAWSAGCVACHGSRLQPGAPNPRKIALAEDAGQERSVPSLEANRHGPAVLREWIAKGIGPKESRSETYRSSRAEHLLQMPAYEDRLTPAEIDDLVVHLILARQASRPMEEMPEGERLARRLGCFSCHGELGQGGVENPGSLKGYIPGFFGRDFELLTDGADRESVRQWIQDGLTTSFRESEGPAGYVARWFLKRQAIGMPAFGALLNAEQLEVLIDYCLELHRLGPLGPEHLGMLASGRPEAEPDTQTSREPGIGVSFVRDVQPILERRCVRCHGAETQKSDYRLDTVQAALRGGTIARLKKRPAIVPGEAGASLLTEMIECQEVDEQREIYPMPPKEDGALSREQIARLRAWIDAGVEWPPGAVLRDPAKSARTERSSP